MRQPRLVQNLQPSYQNHRRAGMTAQMGLQLISVHSVRDEEQCTRSGALDPGSSIWEVETEKSTAQSRPQLHGELQTTWDLIIRTCVLILELFFLSLLFLRHYLFCLQYTIYTIHRPAPSPVRRQEHTLRKMDQPTVYQPYLSKKNVYLYQGEEAHCWPTSVSQNHTALEALRIPDGTH